MFENQLEDKALYGLIDDSSDGSTHIQLLTEDSRDQNGSYGPIRGQDECKSSFSFNYY